MSQVRSKGITLLELVIVLTVFIILVTITLNLYNDYQANQFLSLTFEEVKSTLHEARNASNIGEHESKHGVYFDSSMGTYTLFVGDTFAQRDPQYDLEHKWNHNFITYLGPSEVVFSRITATTADATITLTNTNDKQRHIEINASGFFQ